MVDDTSRDIWHDANGASRVLYGVVVISASARVAELAGRVGYDVVWIDVEHGSVPVGEVEGMCVATECGGAIPLVRVPDAERRHILWALEWGARIIVVPMVNDAATVRRIVEYGKYAPLGRRGYNTRPRGLGFGLQKPTNLFEQANRSTYLFTQVETREAVENVEEICAVEGLEGIFIGPGDLSVAYGCTGDMTNKELIEAAIHCIKTAKSMGKRAGILSPPGPLQQAAREAGAELVIVGSDIGDLAMAWTQQVKGYAA